MKLFLALSYSTPKIRTNEGEVNWSRDFSKPKRGLEFLRSINFR